MGNIFFFGFYKTRHILLSNGANCTVLRAVILSQYRRVADRQTDRQTDGQTDGRTDGIAVANTALAMRVVKTRLIDEWAQFEQSIVDASIIQ